MLFASVAARSLAPWLPPSPDPRALHPKLTAHDFGKLAAKRELADKHIGEHVEVTAQAPAESLEGGGLVFFEDEMAHPGEAVTDERAGEKERWAAENDGRNEKNYDAAGAYKMKRSADAVAVLT